MENLIDLKVIITTGIGVVGGLIASLFGGWNMSLKTLIIFMVIDYIAGLLVAGVFKKSTKTENGALESRSGWKGLCQKGMTLFIVLIAHRLDMTVGSTFIKDTVVIGYITNEAISIIENAGLMGVPINKSLSNAIEILKSKEDNNVK